MNIVIKLTSVDVNTTLGILDYNKIINYPKTGYLLTLKSQKGLHKYLKNNSFNVGH